MKKPIIIHRPDGNIPGLLDLNEFLTKNFGMTIGLEFDTLDLNYNVWIKPILYNSHIEGEEIIVGDRIF